MAEKIVLRNKEAREKLKRGVDLCADLVGSTMGPWGRNIAIEWIGKWPHFVDDGVTVARKIEVGDETENLGILTLVNAATTTDDDIGDGTTAAVVLARAIINDVFKKLDDNEGLLGGSNFNVVQAYKDINEWAEKVIEEIDRRKKLIETEEELIKIATISAKDKHLGELIGKMMWKLGKNGHVTVEDSYIDGIEADVIEGLHFYGKPAADFMLGEHKEAKMENVPIFVTNYTIEDLGQFYRMKAGIKDLTIDDFIKSGQRELVFIAPDFGQVFLKEAFGNFRHRGIKLLALKVKSLTDDQIEDIAVYVGSTFVDKRKDHKLNQATKEDWGRASFVSYSKEKVAILGGKGKKEDIEKRVEDLKIQRKKEEDDLFQKKLDRRISALSQGVGIIKIGSDSDIRKIFLVKKAEDSKNSCRAALEDGIVKGGGLCLKEIAEALPENILTEALKSPYNQIQYNAGGNLKIGDEVIDAASVIKTSLRNAASVASTFIMCGGSIATKRRDLFDDMVANMREDERFKSLLPEKDREKETDEWRENAANF